MWPAAGSTAEHKGEAHSASQELSDCAQDSQLLREQTVPVPLCCKGREDRSGFHDHRQLHGHLSKGCYLHLHPVCPHLSVPGSAKQYLLSRSSNTRASGWWSAYMPVASNISVICLCEAYELCLIPGAWVLVKTSSFVLMRGSDTFSDLFVWFGVFLYLSWAKIYRRWNDNRKKTHLIFMVSSQMEHKSKPRKKKSTRIGEAAVGTYCRDD